MGESCWGPVPIGPVAFGGATAEADREKWAGCGRQRG